jgi:hypothetical protein
VLADLLVIASMYFLAALVLLPGFTAHTSHCIWVAPPLHVLSTMCLLAWLKHRCGQDCVEISGDDEADTVEEHYIFTVATLHWGCPDCVCSMICTCLVTFVSHCCNVTAAKILNVMVRTRNWIPSPVHRGRLYCTLHALGVFGQTCISSGQLLTTLMGELQVCK